MNAPIIFITGAGKGIGRACAQEIIHRAANTRLDSKQVDFKPKLFLTSRTKADLQPLAQDASKAGVEVAILARDLVDAPTEAFEACVSRWGRVDVCMHSAGVGRFGDFLSLTQDDLSFVMKTNVEASFLLMQSVYKQMAHQRTGQIQWITSVAAEKPFEQSAIYCMSKYAQRGLIDVMRTQGYKDQVRILEVRPGAAYTPMWGEMPKEQVDRMMDARDVAQAMVDAIFIPERASIETLTIRPISGDL
jgi:sepiapterin reductase